VIELGLKSWLVAGVVPGVARQPLKKLAVDESALLKLLHRWREEAEKAGHRIIRVAVAFEAGRDGFWLARWLRSSPRIEDKRSWARSVPAAIHWTGRRAW
jgi:transposase